MFKKRGELTSSQIIVLVIAVVSLVILLFFMFINSEIGGTAKEDVCKVSVLTRATTPSAVQQAIPLKCTTQKICITKGEDCPEFRGEDKSYITTVVLPTDKKDAANLIAETQANAMYSCWDMMGQGKLDLFGTALEKFGFGSKVSSCVICSRVALAPSVLKDTALLGLVDVNNYMAHTQVPGSSFTYLQTFTDRGVSSYSSFKQDNYNQFLGDSKLGQTKALLESSTDSKASAESAIVFMQIKSISPLDALKNLGLAGATVVAGSFVVPGGSLLQSGASVALKNPYVAGIAVAAIAGTAVYAGINAYNGQLTAAGYCGSFTTSNSVAQKGCSLVQGMNYNFTAVNSLCSVIEGNP